jgi:hypothetical protein
LQSSSPAIDKGVSVSYITTDYDNNPRLQGAGVDIGAYEYTGTALPPTTPPTKTSTPLPNPTRTFTPVPIKTNTPIPTAVIPTPIATQECKVVVFNDGTKITVCK